MCVPRAGKCGQFVGELFWVKAPVPPRKLLVVNRLVENPVVVEGRKEPAFYAGKQVADIDQIVVAQRKDVGLVASIRRGG